MTVDLASTDTEAVVRVRDNGRGIAGSLLPYVFDRFKQGEGESSRSRAGLGLGLAIVREMVVRDTIKLVVCLPCKPWLTASVGYLGFRTACRSTDRASSAVAIADPLACTRSKRRPPDRELASARFATNRVLHPSSESRSKGASLLRQSTKADSSAA